MFNNLAASYCWDPASFSIMDLSNVLFPTAYGIGFDDIAADGESRGLAADDIGCDDLVAEPETSDISNDLVAAEPKSPEPSSSRSFGGIKIASFANKSE